MKKVALVTGSSRGIGRAVAAELARDGYAVCINYYERKDKADELVALLRAEGREAIAVQADVSKRSEVNAMVAQCERVRPMSACFVQEYVTSHDAPCWPQIDEMFTMQPLFSCSMFGSTA